MAGFEFDGWVGLGSVRTNDLLSEVSNEPNHLLSHLPTATVTNDCLLCYATLIHTLSVENRRRRSFRASLSSKSNMQSSKKLMMRRFLNCCKNCDGRQKRPVSINLAVSSIQTFSQPLVRLAFIRTYTSSACTCR